MIALLYSVVCYTTWFTIEAPVLDFISMVNKSVVLFYTVFKIKYRGQTCETWDMTKLLEIYIIITTQLNPMIQELDNVFTETFLP